MRLIKAFVQASHQSPDRAQEVPGSGELRRNFMKIKIVSTSLMLLLVGGMHPATAEEETNTFREISAHYEAIRLSLLSDATTDVAKHAKDIRSRVDELMKEFGAQDAGVPAEKSAECEALLPEVSSAAVRLAGPLSQVGRN
jgi:hypothetical protein